ncbi:restriction endonuclease subunit S [Fusobacterium periodonticum]|uniref:restriction endonuclease subunit S n=1 Tax=Fusobacterium periodonticum TaxID=860 RepID=UPI000302802F|nr:restriction endonuclease subunit S [Fusobacterium periodonticum]
MEEFINKEKENLSSGSAYNALTIDKLKKFSIFIPPIELQNKFAERIEKIEKLSFISKKLPIFMDFKVLYKKVSA